MGRRGEFDLVYEKGKMIKEKGNLVIREFPEKLKKRKKNGDLKLVSLGEKKD